MQPGSWHLLLDLLFPEGFSINGRTDTDICSLSYVSVDDVARLIIAHGLEAALAKVDKKRVYWIVLILLKDRHLLCMKWYSSLYANTLLPSGLQSAPKVFRAVADTAKWIIKQKG